MPPAVSGEVWGLFSSAIAGWSGEMTGKILIKETLSRAGLPFKGMCDSSQCLSDIPFDCDLPNPGPRSIAAAFCTPIDQESHSYNSYTSNWRIDMDPWTLAASTILVITTTIDNDGWKPLDNTSAKLPQPDIKDEWASYDFGFGRVVNLTVCFNAVNIMLSNVSMTTRKDLMEPTVGHTSNATDTANIRKFLGADPMVQDLSERGILAIKEIKDRNDHVFGANNSRQVPSFQQAAGYLDYATRWTQTNETFAGCEYCSGYYTSSAREYSKTFFDVIMSTGRASVAIQSVYTILGQSLHDQLLDYLTIPMPIEVVQTLSTTVPTRCTGLIAVTVLVFANITCILALTALYLLHSRYTMIGNFWHAISQTVSELTSDVLSHGNQTNDSNISDFLKENDRPVRLTKLIETGHVKIVEAESASNLPVDSERPRRELKDVWTKVKKWA
jgi:hypothetical protein